jgi:DNA-binding transcriptional LysR family regulator
MELHQLRYFLAVVDESSFTAAAHAVRISQSGVSTQLQKLERELGVTLVDRSARRVALTPAGARLVPYARTAVAAVDDVTGAANAIRGLVVGSLRVATVTGMVWEPLFDGLTTLHAEHPGIDIRLQEGASDDLVAQVRAGTVDVAVAAWADREPDGLRVSVVFDDPLVAVVGHGHPWAARGSIRPAELARAALIALPDGTGARAALSALMTRTGKPVQPRWEVATPAYVENLTARGLGVGIVSATTAQDWVDVVALRIDDKRARSRLGIVWRHRPSHAAQALLRRLVPQEGDRPARAE